MKVHAGEKEQYLNASLSKLQMFPSTSTFCTSEKSTYVLMNNDMWSALLSNTKCDECDMCSLDVEYKTPKHSKCPTGSTSWCFYQRALAKNENPMSHSLMKTKLSEQVLEKYFQYIKGL
ncbi:hypothetical protein TNCV_3178821 [Trichonephila clavipes]|nr:hypothetical protein TNCV_3178821 [Trichonephila clavipes]